MAQKPKRQLPPQSLANLKRFPKGVSGNPGGRPKKLPIADAIRLELQKKKGNVDNATAIAKKLIELALSGDLKAMEILADRAEGKPTQRVENTGAEGGPMQFDVPPDRKSLEVRIAELLKK